MLLYCLQCCAASLPGLYVSSGIPYRPSSAEAHKATFEFIQSVVEEPFRKSVSYFDQARKKRHRTIYDDVGVISEKEAKELLSRAREFLSYIESKLKEQ